MGGSRSYSSGGRRGIFDGCGGTLEFTLLYASDVDIDYNIIKSDDEVKIRLVKGNLPRLEVVTIKDEMLVGLVPPTYSMLIKCIEKGWKYYGRIVHVEGEAFDPRIYIKVSGEY